MIKQHILYYWLCLRLYCAAVHFYVLIYMLYITIYNKLSNTNFPAHIPPHP